MVFEALAYGDVSTTAYLTIHNMNCGAIDRWGTEEQRKHWLPSMVTMVGAVPCTVLHIDVDQMLPAGTSDECCPSWAALYPCLQPQLAKHLHKNN